MQSPHELKAVAFDTYAIPTDSKTVMVVAENMGATRPWALYLGVRRNPRHRGCRAGQPPRANAVLKFNEKWDWGVLLIPVLPGQDDVRPHDDGDRRRSPGRA